LKVAVTSAGPGLSSALDSRFGRAAYLLLVDLPERTVSAIENRAGLNAAQGAGIQAAQSVIDAGASKLITGHCGPKAYRVLQAAGIEVLLADGGSVDEVVDRFEAGSLAPALAADVDSHW